MIFSKFTKIGIMNIRYKNFGKITLRDKNRYNELPKTCVSEKVPFEIETNRNKTLLAYKSS